MDTRKPLAHAPAQSMEPYPIRLLPVTIDRVKEMAAELGVPHTTLAREFLIDGMSMAKARAIAKEDRRGTA